ncbi:DUF2637 domain-containing protein [Streptomyces aurantiacus]|uniref:DUF2637 domain-containing protein n=1 Tax=Streptomyces aurantiacus JA 4570 TaxID=1286094 RepID=S3ZAX9_9ACTN|nr:DUF2637 domain-containing protein [Streptomyces aurantiacus]EPH40871.1 hypothetical protein STRAU_6086 [Streptomyces aurantiacus JA 4570]
MKNPSREHPAINPDQRPRRGRVTDRLGYRIGIGIIAPAAAGIVAWSLYVVAHDMYGVPKLLAGLVAACFDGIALACLYLASEAVREGRSALGPRLVTLLQAAISMYLNHLHAEHIGGGVGATLMFAAPTAGLLLLFDQSWAATRARHRVARGEHPMRWPVFGWLGWLLAGEQAWEATKRRAVAHVTGADDKGEDEPATGPRKPAELLASELAGLPPTKAIRIGHESRPELTPAQLAEVLRQYGQDVTELDVAIVLDRVPRSTGYTVARADAPPPHSETPAPHHLVITVQQPEALPAASTPPPPPGPPVDPTPNFADQQSGIGPSPIEQIVDKALAGEGRSKAGAVRCIRAALPNLTAPQVAAQMVRRGFETTDGYVRTVNSRDARKPKVVQALPRREPNGPYL